jgi:diguanylate cyclase (GGDEF)-like protein
MARELPVFGRENIVQEHREAAPTDWADVQDRLAAVAGLSLLLVDGPQPPALVVSNNNSICAAFQTSPQHAHLCEPYCGDAHRRALSQEGLSHYRCHAGLHCFAMPVGIGPERKLAMIGGRAFIGSSDYRALVERMRSGDLDQLREAQPFANVVFALRNQLDELAGRVAREVADYDRRQRESQPEIAPPEPAVEEEPVAEQESIEVAPEVPDEGTSGLQQEVNRLRDELAYRSRLTDALQHFLERITSSDPERTYVAVLSNSRDLLQAERASIQIFDESTSELVIKAAVGMTTEISTLSPTRLGEGIAGRVLGQERPLLVADVEGSGLEPAPASRGYKTKSFLCYPIVINGRKVGVLNLTDKTGGGAYDSVDLSLLEIISPQVAVALERAEWQEKANQFQLISITDPLTGLPNRRYLEERLNEELKRSRRYEYPMSFLMIDIDDFKLYNDLNGHPAGDAALQITANCLKAALRSADIASRYGGEEFCILLPQTSLVEAGVIAERIRERVASETFPYGRSQPLGALTISIGVSTFSGSTDTPQKVIGAADRALYRAKSLGKNRIEFYQETLVGAAGRNEYGDPR